MSAANTSIATGGGFARDLLASVVVFLVALPLCMGIAIASGAPPAAGLITGIIGGLVAGGLAGCPLQVSGPAAIRSGSGLPLIPSLYRSCPRVN